MQNSSHNLKIHDLKTHAKIPNIQHDISEKNIRDVKYLKCDYFNFVI